MSTGSTSLVVVGVDASRQSLIALRWAAEYARATARSLAPVARAYSAAQRSAIRDWRDASTPTTTRDVDPVDMPIHRFRDISHHASVISHTTLLRLARNGQVRKSPYLSCSRGLEMPANHFIFGESTRALYARIP